MHLCYFVNRIRFSATLNTNQDTNIKYREYIVCQNKKGGNEIVFTIFNLTTFNMSFPTEFQKDTEKSPES